MKLVSAGLSWGVLLVAVSVMLTGCGAYMRPACPPMGSCYMPGGAAGGFGPGGFGAGTASGGQGYGQNAGLDGRGYPYGSTGSNLNANDYWSADTRPRFTGDPTSRLDTVYYDFDSSRIRPDQVNSLQRNLAWLQQNPDVPVRIEGHCDERGTEEYNLALGDRRAETVRGWLVSQGQPSGRFQTVSKGEYEPADPGHSESAWAKNRRAEVLLFQ